ncbi:MAG: 7-cyano-7-deazaguanine synthase QueC [Deltaproteobacteria bacterium]|nr:7-cyano-7-deazaguanine synthase QueC [Deltaproteobacteria bacterium]
MDDMNNKRAVVLFSGGLDSSTVLKIAIDEGFEVIPLTFFYNQRHKTEIGHAKKIVKFFNLKNHVIVSLDFGQIKGSALIDLSMDVPKNRIKENRVRQDLNETGETGNVDDIPVTYVPARNTVFLSYALAVAEVNMAGDIFIGANHIDYSGYPDCRPDYLRAFEKMANLATKASVTGEINFKINAPLLKLTKKDIIIRAFEIGAPLELTHSCYDPVEGLACGVCDSCILRRRGFEEAKIKDPAKYYKG